MSTTTLIIDPSKMGTLMAQASKVDVFNNTEGIFNASIRNYISAHFFTPIPNIILVSNAKERIGYGSKFWTKEIKKIIPKIFVRFPMLGHMYVICQSHGQKIYVRFVSLVSVLMCSNESTLSEEDKVNQRLENHNQKTPWECLKTSKASKVYSCMHYVRRFMGDEPK